MKVYVPTMCILTDPENIVEGRVKVHMQRRTRVELPVTWFIIVRLVSPAVCTEIEKFMYLRFYLII